MEKGIAVVDGIVILHRMKSNALQTVVDISHCFNQLLRSMTREYDEIMLVFDMYCKDVSLKCMRLEKHSYRVSIQPSTRSMMKRASTIINFSVHLCVCLSVSVCVCLCVCLYPLFSTRPSDCNQIWHAYAG